MEQKEESKRGPQSTQDVNKLSYMKHKFLNVMQGQDEYVY